MKTRVTELLGIRYPIIQGGMAWVAENHLAAAVSEAGGFGLLGAASAPAEVIRREIRAVKAQTDRPFGVNIMLLSPYAEEVAHVVVEEGVTAVTTGAGSPEKYMKLWKDAGIKVIPVVASVALAKRMERCGADAVVAEGMESGGHIGAAAPGGGCCGDSGDWSRRNCRWKRCSGSLCAGCGGRADGDPFCSLKRIGGTSEL